MLIAIRLKSLRFYLGMIQDLLPIEKWKEEIALGTIEFHVFQH